MQTWNAHFDGQFIVLDEPTRLKPNAKVTVIAPETNEERADYCARLSESTFRKIWDNSLDADYDSL